MCNFLHPLFGIEKWKDTFCLAVVAYFGRKELIHFYLQLYSPTFRNRKSRNRFSRLRRRRESVATWRILHTATNYASEISKILILHCPQSCVAKSPRDRRADMGFCTKLNHFGKSVTINIFKQSIGHTFPPSSLARDDYG